MAYLRTAYNDGVGQTYLRVLIDDLTASSYRSLIIYNYTTGQSYYASVDASKGGGYWYSTTQTFSGLSAGRQYAFYAEATTTGGTKVRIPSSGYSYFNTASANYPPSTPNFYISSNSGLNANFYVGFPSGATSVTIRDNYGWSRTVYSSASYSYTASYYNTTIYLYAYASNAYGSSNDVSDYFTTGSPPTPSNPTITRGTINGNQVNFSITVPSNASYVNVWDNRGLSDRNFYSSGSYSFVGDYNTSYTLYARAWNSYGGSPSTPSITFTTGSPPTPPQPTFTIGTISGKTINYNVTIPSGATGVEISDETTWKRNITSSGSYSYTASAYNKSGTLWARSYNSSNIYSSYVTRTYKSGADNVAPTIRLAGTDRFNAITVSWTASDDEALRSGNTFHTEISPAYTSTQSNPTYYSKGYVGFDSRSVTFQTDGNNNGLIVGRYYYWRITAYDSSGNNASISGYLQYARTRPTNFSWTRSKSSGSAFNLTASEWRSLQLRVNEFRQYKGLVELSFTAPVSGGDFTATHFNQIVNAIKTMSPSTSPPSDVKSRGHTIYARDLNALVTSLNSIS